MPVNTNYGTGRRKTATARVHLRPGNGNIRINGRSLDEFFGRQTSRMIVRQPLETAQVTDRFDVEINVDGGGITGQTDAVTLGLARALVKMNPDFVPALRKNGLLTRDPRIKERKKPGLKRARKAPTYTKR
jgi:small subunit ribosomal protein S9